MKTVSYKILQRESRSYELFQTLRDRIACGAYPPGSLLSEKDLTQEFGISRTPYREAIQQLESMKLVKVVPRFGTFVSEIDLKEIFNAYEVRLRLEVMAAELSAKNRTDNDLKEIEDLFNYYCCYWKNGDYHEYGSEIDASLHEIICKTSYNDILIESVRNLRLICGRLWTTSWRDNYNFEKLMSDWSQIIGEIKVKNMKNSGMAMENHIKDSITLLKKISLNMAKL